jgi:uncharacterized membrane protein YoaK (UPF0700 family)
MKKICKPRSKQKNKTEDDLMSSTYPPSSKYKLEESQMKIEAGFLGKVFGTNKNAPVNIAGASIIILMIAGICSTFLSTDTPDLEFWKVIAPIITAILVYLFGKRS